MNRWTQIIRNHFENEEWQVRIAYQLDFLCSARGYDAHHRRFKYATSASDVMRAALAEWLQETLGEMLFASGFKLTLTDVIQSAALELVDWADIVDDILEKRASK